MIKFPRLFNSENLQIYKILQSCKTIKIPKTFNLKKYQILSVWTTKEKKINKYIRKLKNRITHLSLFWFFEKISIRKIPKIFCFEKFKLAIYEIPKVYHFKNSKNFQFGKFEKFRKSSNFWNCSISKNINNKKKSQAQNSINFQFYNLSYILSVRKIRTNIK